MRCSESRLTGVVPSDILGSCGCISGSPGVGENGAIEQRDREPQQFRDNVNRAERDQNRVDKQDTAHREMQFVRPLIGKFEFPSHKFYFLVVVIVRVRCSSNIVSFRKQEMPASRSLIMEPNRQGLWGNRLGQVPYDDFPGAARNLSLLQCCQTALTSVFCGRCGW